MIMTLDMFKDFTKETFSIQSGLSERLSDPLVLQKARNNKKKLHSIFSFEHYWFYCFCFKTGSRVVKTGLKLTT